MTAKKTSHPGLVGKKPGDKVEIATKQPGGIEPGPHMVNGTHVVVCGSGKILRD